MGGPPPVETRKRAARRALQASSAPLQQHLLPSPHPPLLPACMHSLPVKQTSSSEPLLVGETDVVALQGAATFKLRITSLSSHRDKQRFRIQARAPSRTTYPTITPSVRLERSCTALG